MEVVKKRMEGVDIADYLERHFPELKSTVSSDSEGVGHKITSDFCVSYHAEWGLCEAELYHLALNGLYRAIGNLTVMAESYRSELYGC